MDSDERLRLITVTWKSLIQSIWLHTRI